MASQLIAFNAGHEIEPISSHLSTPGGSQLRNGSQHAHSPNAAALRKYAPHRFILRGFVLVVLLTGQSCEILREGEAALQRLGASSTSTHHRERSEHILVQ